MTNTSMTQEFVFVNPDGTREPVRFLQLGESRMAHKKKEHMMEKKKEKKHEIHEKKEMKPMKKEPKKK